MPSAPNSTDLDRKALKRPDRFTQTVRRFFGNLAQNSKLLMAVAAVLIVAGISAAVYRSNQKALAEEARDALYLAEKAVQEELEALAPKKEAPKPPEDVTARGKADEKKTAEKKSEKPEMIPDVEAILFKDLEVDQKLARGVSALKGVAEKYKGTRSAYDARMKLANLYYRHGKPAKAISWYESAVSSAPNSFEKTLALYGLGYAREMAGKREEALKDYQTALDVKSETDPLKGDLLLAMARNYQELGQKDKALEIYGKITSELPETKFADTAEALKAHLN